MKVGLIDVDNHQKLNKCFPNITLMKLSTYYKKLGYDVEFYDPMFSGHCDIVYAAKVFSFTDDYEYIIDADRIIKIGSGYSIQNVDGIEVWNDKNYTRLSDEIYKQFPDYSLYGITDTAYGFMTRGCPRQCSFCHVKDIDGIVSRKVADLSDFWNGQKYIELLDPNTFACREWLDVVHQLQESKSYVNFNQGVDIRMMTERKCEEILKIRTKGIHFAFDRWEDKDLIMPRLQTFKDVTNWGRNKVSVYVLCNFNTSIEQDLERIMFIRSLGFNPYVMLYNKYLLPKGHIMKKLQRWVNNKFIFWSTENFNEYLNGVNNKKDKYEN